MRVVCMYPSLCACECASLVCSTHFRAELPSTMMLPISWEYICHRTCAQVKKRNRHISWRYHYTTYVYVCILSRADDPKPASLPSPPTHTQPKACAYLGGGIKAERLRHKCTLHFVVDGGRHRDHLAMCVCLLRGGMSESEVEDG